MRRRSRWRTMALVLAGSLAAAGAHAQDAWPPAVLFENVRIFDGKSGSLSAGSSVLVRGNRIEAISTAPIAVDRSAGVTVIRGDGRTLMPGLIDAHAHLAMATIPQMALMTGDASYAALRAGVDAGAMLMRGITLVRDAGADLRGHRPRHRAR